MSKKSGLSNEQSRRQTRELFFNCGLSRLAQYGIFGLDIGQMADDISRSRSSFYSNWSTKDHFLEETINFLLSQASQLANPQAKNLKELARTYLLAKAGNTTLPPI